MRKTAILAALLAPIFSAASGPTGALRIRRAAVKARNRAANRRNHRG